MATYKVLQDIEAEDKIIGRLTLRQFIYASMAALFLYLSYVFINKGVPFLAVPFLPVALVLAFFAFPWMRDQPTEIWALAKIRFLFKPRRRIWNQDGLKELVTITVPKKIAMNYTNGLSQTEVRSRLRTLADTIDSRGWAIRNTNLNLADPTSSFATTNTDSDRLVAASILPQQQKTVESDVRAADDILDEQNNSGAQRLKGLVDKTSRERRERLMTNLKEGSKQPTPKQANDYWFLNRPTAAAKIPGNMITFGTQVVEPGAADNSLAGTSAATPDEANLVAELDVRKRGASGAGQYSHMHQIQPLSAQKQTVAKPAQTPQAPTPQPTQTAPLNSAATPVSTPVTPPDQTAILSLAGNKDLSVQTLAREAKRGTLQDEVVVKLH